MEIRSNFLALTYKQLIHTFLNKLLDEEWVPRRFLSIQKKQNYDYSLYPSNEQSQLELRKHYVG